MQVSATRHLRRGFTNSELAVMRGDDLLASLALASHAASYEVIGNDATGMASGHYPVTATCEMAA